MIPGLDRMSVEFRRGYIIGRAIEFLMDGTDRAVTQAYNLLALLHPKDAANEIYEASTVDIPDFVNPVPNPVIDRAMNNLRLKSEEPPVPSAPEEERAASGKETAAAALGDMQTKSLSPRQRQCLELMIEMNRVEVPCTQKAISERMNVDNVVGREYLKILVKKKFATEGKIENSRCLFYRAILRPDGTPIKQLETTVINGVKVTKCPPAYAQGYGFNKSELENING